MIPLTHHGNITNLTEFFKIYVAEYNFASGGTRAIFTHEDSYGRRFIPIIIGTHCILNSTSATMTLGQVSTSYNDIMISVSVGTTGDFRNRTVLVGGAANRTSIASGTTVYSVLSAACSFRIYVAGFLV